MVDRYEVYDAKGRGQLSKVKTQEGMFDGMKSAVGDTIFAKDRRIVLVGDSVLTSCLIPDGSMDFVFIDAGHEAPAILADLQSYHRKVRAGGLFFGHDYNGSRDRTGVFGVKLAVDQFCGSNGLKVSSSKRHL